MDGSKKLFAFLIDDDDIFTDIVRRRLESEGMEVERAANGDEGMQRLSDLAAENRRPDAILLDFSMPGLTGVDVLKSLQHNQELNTIPIGLLSNFSRTDDIAWAQKLGAKKTIDKTTVLPADIPDIIRELAKH